MPNGGYPTCDGCWFNRSNQGDDGWQSEGSLAGWFWHPKNPRKNPPEPFCEIRGVKLTGTDGHPCCANHPFFRFDRDPIPIGPLWQSFSGPSDANYIVAPSPDTEPIRLHLLQLLKELFASEEKPAVHRSLRYEFLGTAIVEQLTEFREPRAIPPLKRIAKMDSALAQTARQALLELEE